MLKPMIDIPLASLDARLRFYPDDPKRLTRSRRRSAVGEAESWLRSWCPTWLAMSHRICESMRQMILPEWKALARSSKPAFAE
jgi:hypothetical protein